MLLDPEKATNEALVLLDEFGFVFIGNAIVRYTVNGASQER
jgi:hypothetical protein